MLVDLSGLADLEPQTSYGLSIGNRGSPYGDCPLPLLHSQPGAGNHVRHSIMAIDEIGRNPTLSGLGVAGRAPLEEGTQM